jgi:hypothetical protein
MNEINIILLGINIFLGVLLFMILIKQNHITGYSEI